MTVKVLILEDNPVARGFLGRVVRESFSDDIVITEAGDLDTARRRVGPLRDPAAAQALGQQVSARIQPALLPKRLVLPVPRPAEVWAWAEAALPGRRPTPARECRDHAGTSYARTWRNAPIVHRYRWRCREPHSGCCTRGTQ